MGLFDRFRSKPGAVPDDNTGVGRFRLVPESAQQASLYLDLGDLPTDAVVEGAGEEPNGAFWEGVAWYVAPALASRLDLDSEGTMFGVHGDRPDLEELCALLAPLVGSLGDDRFGAAGTSGRRHVGGARAIVSRQLPEHSYAVP